MEVVRGKCSESDQTGNNCAYKSNLLLLMSLHWPQQQGVNGQDVLTFASPEQLQQDLRLTRLPPAKSGAAAQPSWVEGSTCDRGLARRHLCLKMKPSLTKSLNT